MDTLLQKSNLIEILPLNPIQKDAPLEFQLGPWHDRFVDTSSIRICGQLRLKKVAANGTTSNTTDADDVSVVSCFPLAMFKSLSVTLNETEVMDLRNPCYPFKCYMDTICSYSPNACATVTSTQYFTKQTIGSEDNNEKPSTGTDTSGYGINKKFVIGDKLVEFISSTFCEMFNSQRLLIPGVQIKMKFLPSDTNFPIISALANKDKFRLELINAKIVAKLVTVEPTVLPSLMDRLDQGEKCLYPFIRTSVTTHTIPAGTSTHEFPMLFNGPLPTQILAGFMGVGNFEGAIDKNPFVFGPNDVTQFTFLKNGEPVHDYKTNYDEGVFLQAYQSLLDTLGINRSNIALNVNPSIFKSNFAFYSYNDSPVSICLFTNKGTKKSITLLPFHFQDSCNNSHIHFTPSSSMGVISARVTFSKALDNPLKMILFASHGKCLSIDKSLNTKLENTV